MLFSDFNVTSGQLKDLMNEVMPYIAQELDTAPNKSLLTNLTYTPNESETFSEDGQSTEQVLSDLFAKMKFGRNSLSPGYLSYVPGGGLTICAVSDFIANCLNKYTGYVCGAPACVDIERKVVSWIARQFYTAESTESQPFGFLTSGGSSAHNAAVNIALNEKGLENLQKYVIYMSDQTHVCLRKSAKLCGISRDRVRLIATKPNCEIDTDILQEQIQLDKKNGLIPLMIVGNAGTVNTGAIDNFQILSQIAQAENAWFHIDGCFGGFYIMSERVRNLMYGISESDSIAIDPHKGLFLPYGTGCLVVKDVHVLKRTFASSHEAEYIHGTQMDSTFHELEYYDLADMTPEQTRPFRALRIWLPFKLFGTKLFETTICERLDLAQRACDQLRQIRGVEIVSEPVISCFNFRVVKDNCDDQVLNQRLIQYVNSRFRVALHSTIVNGKIVVRVVTSSFRTTEQTVKYLIEDVHKGVELILSEQ